MVFDQVKESLAEIKSLNPDTIEMDSNLSKDLGVDSVDAVELIMAMEEAYDITISEKDAEDLATVADIVEYIEDHIEE